MQSGPSGEAVPEPASDLTARAQIRDAALALFAEHGPDAVSVRQIAERAGVSTALVLYHYGSKAGLKEAVDAHAASASGDLFELGDSEGLVDDLTRGDATSLAEMFARSFPPGSPLPAYLRRLLLSGDPAGEQLFRQWYEATLQMLEAMGEAGYVAPSEDPEVRAAFMLANDLALIVLRGPIGAALGIDPMSPDGLARWAREANLVYRDGVWAGGATPPDPGQDPGQEGTHG